MNILYIEDNLADRVLVKTIIRNINPVDNIYIFPDGPAAISFMRSMTQKNNGKFLDVVLLDFGLPKMNGIEVMQLIKSDELLSKIPVVGFSASIPIRDEFIKHGADAFIEKKSDYLQMESDIKTLLSNFRNRPMDGNS